MLLGHIALGCVVNVENPMKKSDVGNVDMYGVTVAKMVGSREHKGEKDGIF
jgi:hypothetical protein